MEPPSTYLADEKLPKVTDLLNSTKPDGFKIRVAYSSAKCSVNYVAPEKPLDDLLDSLTVKTDAKKEEDQLFEYVLEIYTVPTTEASVLWAKGHEYYPFNDTLDCYGKSLFQKLTFFSPTIALTDAEELFNIVEHDPKATKPQNLSKESNIGVYFDWVPEFGQVYEIHCRKLTKTNEKVEEEGCTIQASYNQSELQRLYDRAVNFSAQEFRKRHPPSKTARITKAYRVKKREYFENIRIGDTEFGVMEPHVKNNHGHHENNINHFLEGTFFSTQVQYNGNQPNFSYFGDTKMLGLLHFWREDTNLYFADFYCNGTKTNPHYMTIVACKKGSKSDWYCANKLLPLPDQNDFLRIHETKYGTYYYNSYVVWMELFFTEEFPVNLTRLESIKFIDYGSRGDGAQNKINCPDCNIYRNM